MAWFCIELHQHGGTSCISNSARDRLRHVLLNDAHFDYFISRDGYMEIEHVVLQFLSYFETVQDCFVFNGASRI